MEQQPKNFIKIRTSVMLNGTKITQEQIDGIYEEEERIREKLILPLNEAIGLHNWAIQFTIISYGDYFADIYLDDLEKYGVMVSIIRNHVTDRQLTFWYQGGIAKYIGSQ
jgi:hypothetical protein